MEPWHKNMKYNANTLMRDPDWNRGKRACTVAISLTDASALKLVDGQQVRVFHRGGQRKGVTWRSPLRSGREWS